MRYEIFYHRESGSYNVKVTHASDTALVYNTDDLGAFQKLVGFIVTLGSMPDISFEMFEELLRHYTEDKPIGVFYKLKDIL